MQLNGAQASAVEHESGPLLVVAGAGTGKTRVIVERIKKLLDGGIQPESIVALTFTEKAAQEMDDRLMELTGQYLSEVKVATYNSFGESLLKKYSMDIGLTPAFKLLNEKSMAIFMRQNLDRYKLKYYKPIGDPAGHIVELLNYFSKLKGGDVTTEQLRKCIEEIDFDAELEKQRQYELCDAYDTHQKLCLEKGVIDYDDQIFLVNRLLERRPNVLASLCVKYKYFLVDEFQDTSKMQAKMAYALSSKTKNIMAVGDDDQAIYGFRGADISNILDFKKTFDGAVQVALTDNYRSGQSVLDSSHLLIQNNNPNRLESTLGINKQLNSHTEGSSVVVTEFTDLNSELDALSRDIAKKIEGGHQPESIAVLLRKNALAPKISQLLDHYKVPWHIAGSTHDLFKERVVVVLVNVLKLLVNPSSNHLLHSVLSGQLFEKYSIELAHALEQAHKTHKSLIEELRDGEEYKEPLAIIDNWRKNANKQTVAQTILDILEDTGLKDSLLANAQENQKSAKDVMYISQLFDAVNDFTKSQTDTSLFSFIENIELIAQLNEGKSDDQDFDDQGGVSVMTIHKAKGLEWDIVYIPNLTQGNLPGVNRNSDIDLPDKFAIKLTREGFVEEERRLMYVAMTRAKKELNISYALDHGGARAKKPSIFIDELSVEVNTSANKSTLQAWSQDAGAADKPFSLPSRFIKNGNLILSVSQINDYRRCPLDFYYRHVLLVPSAENIASGVGTAVHAVLQHVNEDRLEGHLKDTPDYEELLSELWPEAGFNSAKERAEALTRASSAVARHIKTHSSDLKIPNSIEKSFQAKFNDAKLTIKGRFDAVYDYDDYLEIRDYKTSTTQKSEESLTKSASRSDQLTLYALVWQELTGRLPDSLTLDYVLASKIAAVSKKQNSVDKFRDSLTDISSNIMKLNFTPAKSHMFCRHD